MPRVRSDLTRTILRIYQIGNLQRVTICRGFRHSDQINKSEHVRTDRRSFLSANSEYYALFFARDHPGLSSVGGGSPKSHRAKASPIASNYNAAREIRSDPQRPNPAPSGASVQAYPWVKLIRQRDRSAAAAKARAEHDRRPAVMLLDPIRHEFADFVMPPDCAA